MKLILLSDIHGTSKQPKARNDNVLIAFKRKLEFIFKTASELKASILCAGDLFNSPRDIFALFQFVLVKNKYPDVKFITVWGQHDQYCRNKNVMSNLRILEKSGLITILNFSSSSKFYMVENSFFHIYGSGWKEHYFTKPTKRKNITNILITHYPITINPLWQGHEFYHPQKFMKDHKNYDLVLCGDIHREFTYKTKDDRICLNTGPLMRLEATDYNFKHKPKLYIYDTETNKLKYKVIPHALADQVLSRKHLEISQENNSLGELYINSLGELYINTKQIEDVKIMSVIERLIIESQKESKIRNVLDEIIESINHEHTI